MWIKTKSIVKGDTIRFKEGVWSKAFNENKKQGPPDGERWIEAEVVTSSYGAKSGQHSLTLLIISSSGHEALKPGTKTRRMARKVYRNKAERMRWEDEDHRTTIEKEKYRKRDARKQGKQPVEDWNGYAKKSRKRRKNKDHEITVVPNAPKYILRKRSELTKRSTL